MSRGLKPTALAALDRLTVLDEAPAPTLPCPPWCVDPAGHEWETTLTVDDPTVIVRTHRARIVERGVRELVAFERVDRLDVVAGREEAGEPAVVVLLDAVGGSDDHVEIPAQLAAALAVRDSAR